MRGEHAGFSDLFVPLIANGSVEGILTTGPFLQESSNERRHSRELVSADGAPRPSH